MEKVVNVDEVLTAIALKEQRPVSSGGQVPGDHVHPPALTALVPP